MPRTPSVQITLPYALSYLHLCGNLVLLSPRTASALHGPCSAPHHRGMLQLDECKAAFRFLPLQIAGKGLDNASVFSFGVKGPSSITTGIGLSCEIELIYNRADILCILLAPVFRFPAQPRRPYAASNNIGAKDFGSSYARSPHIIFSISTSRSDTPHTCKSSCAMHVFCRSGTAYRTPMHHLRAKHLPARIIACQFEKRAAVTLPSLRIDPHAVPEPF